MRVISGSFRGTRLVELGNAEIRPTLDRVKESFFNQVGQDLSGKTFSDNFYKKILALLPDILKREGSVIVEHFHKTKLQESYGRLKSFKDRRLGDTCLSFFEMEV